MSRTGQVRFRHSQAITVATVIAFAGALPLAAARWFLTPVLLVPLLIGIWAWRAGTDAGRDGVRVRALLRSRLIGWTEVAAVGADSRGRVLAQLTGGQTVALAAVRPADLPRLVAASGRPLSGTAGPVPDPLPDPPSDPPPDQPSGRPPGSRSTDQ